MSERLSLYVHIPFCRAKCPYCDFNSYAGLESLVPSYVDAILAEMLLWRSPARDLTVATVFLGGGTPSVLPITEVERILGAVCESFSLAADAEVSLEANPGTVYAPHLEADRNSVL